MIVQVCCWHSPGFEPLDNIQTVLNTCGEDDGLSVFGMSPPAVQDVCEDRTLRVRQTQPPLVPVPGDGPDSGQVRGLEREAGVVAEVALGDEIAGCSGDDNGLEEISKAFSVNPERRCGIAYHWDTGILVERGQIGLGHCPVALVDDQKIGR